MGFTAKLQATAKGRGILRTFSRWLPFSERYMGAEMHRDMLNHRVSKTVFIECGWHPAASTPEPLRGVGEVELAQRCADSDTLGWPNGIVSHVDLCMGADPLLFTQ